VFTAVAMETVMPPPGSEERHDEERSQRRGVRNKRSDRTTKADATEDKAPEACSATSGADLQTFESAASLFSRDDRPFDSAASLFSRDDGQAENEEIYNMININEPPPVSNIVVQR